MRQSTCQNSFNEEFSTIISVREQFVFSIRNVVGGYDRNRKRHYAFNIAKFATTLTHIQVGHQTNSYDSPREHLYDRDFEEREITDQIYR